MEKDEVKMEDSRTWKLIPSWVVDLWIAWILIVFFVIRVLGSRAAQQFLTWYRHLK